MTNRYVAGFYTALAFILIGSIIDSIANSNWDNFVDQISLILLTAVVGVVLSDRSVNKP